MKKQIKLETRMPGYSDELGHASRFRKVILSPLVCTVSASVGIFGGIFSLFAGLICVVIHGVIAGDTAFGRVGTALLISAIPMILFGSIFLDLIENIHN